MSLDVNLYVTDIDGNDIYVYDNNITHNLNVMAEEAGLYKVLWRPDEYGYKTARELIQTLEVGIQYMKNHREDLLKLNPSNGWGSYEVLLEFSEEYLEACRKYPSSKLSISR